MHRGKAPSRQGRLQKLTRNSDIVHSTSLANSFLREERNLDKKLQNLKTEKRLSLAKMDSEIKLYRKMNKNKIGKWEDNCDMSDVSEAGSDEDEDVHVGYKASFCDSNFKSKTVKYPKGNNSTSDAIDYPSKYSSSFSRFTPFGSSKKVDTSKQFHHSLLRETCSDPLGKFFSLRSRDIPHNFETKKSDGSTRPHLTSGTQKQKAKEFEDFNPRNRSTSIRHAEYTGFLQGENQLGGLHHTGDLQANGLSDHHATRLGGHQGISIGGHQARRLSYHIGGQTYGLSHHTDGHQTGSVFHHMGDLQASGLAPQMGGRHATELPHHMGRHHATGTFDQATGMSQFNGPAIGQLSHLANGTIPTTTGDGHKSIVRIRKLVHAEHHIGEPGSHKPYGINLGPGGFETGAREASHGINDPEVVGMHSHHEPRIKTNKISNFSVNKFNSSALGSKSLEKLGTSAMPTHVSPSHTTSFQGPHLGYNSIAPSAHGLPKQQSNTMHSTYDWVFQNSPPKHLGISIHNPMLFHPRFHNNLGLVDAPEEHTESNDPNSIHVLRKCRYLRIPKPLCHDPGVDHAWCT